MLRELSVQNLALIEDVQVELEGGFCAWTGETGAGKSLLLTALGLVLGGKASADLVRAGKAEARASAVFEIEDQALRGELETILGGVLDEDALIVTRRVSAQGRSAAQVNGMPVTIATLQRLGEQMVDIHGQNEGRALLDPDRQRDLLDAFGALDEPLEAYRRARAAHDGLRRSARPCSTQPRPGSASGPCSSSSVTSWPVPIPGRASTTSWCATRTCWPTRRRSARPRPRATTCSTRRIIPPRRSSSGSRAAWSPWRTRCPSCPGPPRPSSGWPTRPARWPTACAMGQSWEDNPARLEDIEARLALYRRLAARFHCTADELAARRVETEAKLSSIERDEEDLEHLDAPLAEAFQALKSAAAALSAARRKTARDFGRAIQSRLKPLGLEKARLTVEVETRDLGDDPTASSPPEYGADCVEMFFLANPGEAPRPLRKIASGGELSRVTLAAKTVLACTDRVATLVLDEIDTGVGGRLGAALGKTLSELALHHQVVCVTHLPQVACYARRQWVIRKQTERGRTTTTITPLSDADRVNELAPMLRGESAAEGTRQEALAMLREARRQTHSAPGQTDAGLERS